MSWSSPSCPPPLESDFGDFQQFNRSPGKSPSRPRWSPQVHTIAEDAESWTSGLFPTKLFASNGTPTSTAPNLKCIPDQTRIPIAQDDNSFTQGHLAPSLEPNGSQSKENEEEEIPITLDELLSDIKRLAQHDFAVKGAQYHPVLKRRLATVPQRRHMKAAARNGSVNVLSNLNNSPQQGHQLWPTYERLP
ncbi:hypothetical protein BG000_007216 [Podila horticola]|nr:hypothetical protein BG000_007216 [Podila horticola]